MSFNYTDSFDFLGDITASDAEIKMHIDIESERFDFLVKDEKSFYDEYDDETNKRYYFFASKDGILAEAASNDGVEYMRPDSIDIQNKIDAAFYAYDNITNSESEKIDWESILCELAEACYDEDFFDDIDFSKFNEDVNNIFKDASNKKWLEENLNYTFEKSGGEEIYKFQTYESSGLICLLPYYEDAIADEYAKNSFEDILYQLVGTLEIRVKDKKLTYFNISGTFDDKIITIEFKDFDYNADEKVDREIYSIYDDIDCLIKEKNED